jgi:protein MpaA
MKRIALFLTFALSACQATPESFPIQPEQPSSLVEFFQIRDLKSVEGRELKAHSFGDEGDVVLFLATIHGDEAGGTQLIQELQARLETDSSLLGGYRAVLIPVANPDGLANGTRRNAHNVDLNRNFASNNFQGSLYRGQSPLSEPEALFVTEIVRHFRPVRIISFHQAANRIDYDGPGAALAYRLAEHSPLAVHRMGTRPGSLGSWTGSDRQIPTITIELPRSADDLSQAEAWETYGGILTQALSD